MAFPRSLPAAIWPPFLLVAGINLLRGWSALEPGSRFLPDETIHGKFRAAVQANQESEEASLLELSPKGRGGERWSGSKNTKCSAKHKYKMQEQP